MEEKNYIFDDSELSFLAVCDLISKMEKKNYHLHHVPISLYFPEMKYGKLETKEIPHQLVCLIEEGKEKLALEEIEERFVKSKKEANDYILQDGLRMPSKNYIQLACRKRYDGNKICYHESFIFHVGREGKDTIESLICMKPYQYIIDYMETVCSYQEMLPRKITLEDCAMLSSSFVQDFEESKIYTKKN